MTFAYVDMHGTASRRRGEPHRHVHLDAHWYLLCWDLDRAGWRVFRTDRITDLTRTGRHHAPRPLPADTALAYLRSGLS
ncbi:helix-turn-helix transcriptional regulator [Microbacterium trichothecenolyticum]|uniref:DNA-binding transcriptional regulator YafY n=1 Tax=Microbacterium trichothecenolyticum TaxID=69370 RepID=A0ABU0TSK2_MICTR|nr:WYL domain-containing protein [Microbacterium trichothecenolyticum]MDQ1122648.1 putative DNA-binding transcriptional regulator YafY [Microbacterium trichothecenolyticum]